MALFPQYKRYEIQNFIFFYYFIFIYVCIRYTRQSAIERVAWSVCLSVDHVHESC